MGKKFYITTAIDYANDVIHIGHAYQKVAADVIARYHRLLGQEVFFLTGTDEHGAKVQRAAENNNLDPKTFVDKISAEDQRQLSLLNVAPNRFIRTTDSDHIKKVKEFWLKVKKKGDIYLADFHGLYCEGCEEYKMESDLVDGHCSYHPKLKIKKLQEKNYFFRWSKYKNFLKQQILNRKDFLQPEASKKEMLSFLNQDLNDISISRQKQNVSWGIPVPGDSEQTIYVWFDALINYLTGAPQDFWPANLHLLGKDNTRFHALLWPAMLKSAGYSLPKTVYSHGFISLNGRKISKSSGNIIRPQELVDKFTSDGARYILVGCKNLADDGDISWQKMTNTYNADLANGLGNLVARLAKLSQLSKLELTVKAPEFSRVAVGEYKRKMENYHLNEALSFIWRKIKAVDQYLNQEKPWGIKNKTCLGDSLQKAVTQVIEIAVLLAPFLPRTNEKIKKVFIGKKVISCPSLFPRIKE